MDQPERHLEVLACGPGTSLQDRGRFGYQRFGISPSGAMDPLALAQANLLVGNPAGTAAIEFTLLGGRFLVAGGDVRVAFAGPPAALAVGDEPAPADRTLRLEAGQILTVGPLQAGVFGYLAVGGGFDLPPALGSLSLHRRAGLGGLDGRGLRAGDRLPLAAGAAAAVPVLALPAVALDGEAPLRAVPGPQADHFDEAARETFFGSVYRVTPEADRMGFRLAGPKIAHARGFNIVSDGIVSGSVQVPGGGEPIVMMADRQTTGGYPKIATVISADLRRLAQRRPGEAVRFRVVTVAEAEAAARQRAEELAALPGRARPPDALPAVDRLLALNLAGAAVDALSGEG